VADFRGSSLLSSDRIHNAGKARVIAPRSTNAADDFRIGRKATRCFLREGKPAVGFDFEHSAAGSAEANLRRGQFLEDQVPRRTGARLIASQAAIFDFDFHTIRPREFPEMRM
jgi:hypothetical protein